MPKLIVGGALVAAGLIAIASQVFRATPSIPVFLGGIGLAIFAAIYCGDAVDGMYEEGGEQ